MSSLHPYALPPGYSYELDHDADGEPFVMIVDRAGNCVTVTPFRKDGEAFKALWDRIIACPEHLGIHTAAFVVWQINRCPLRSRGPIPK